MPLTIEEVKAELSNRISTLKDYVEIAHIEMKDSRLAEKLLSRQIEANSLLEWINEKEKMAWSKQKISRESF